MNVLRIRTNKNPKIPWNKLKWEHNSKSVGHSESSPKKEIQRISGLPEETRMIPNKQSIITLKRTRKRTTKPKVSRRKEIIKNRREINESLKTIKKPQWNQELVLWKDKQEKKKTQVKPEMKWEITTYTKELQRIVRKY